MKRKLTAILLAAMLLLSACRASETSGSSGSETTSPETSAEPPASSNPNSKPVDSEDEEAIGQYYDTEDQDLTMPDFTLTNHLDETVSFSDYEGKVVVMNFWATWCPPCLAEMPDFQELYEASEEEDFVLLMINQLGSKESETKEQVESFLAKNEYTFPVLYDDQWDVAYGIFGMNSIPFTVVVDEQGKVSRYAVGTTTKKTVLKMIEEARNA